MNTHSSKARRGRSFQKGQSGNLNGRPRGARNRTSLAVEALLDGEAEALTRKAIELALNGDITAIRICLDRILPPCRERRLNFEMPPLNWPEDSVKAMAAIAAAVAAGELTLSEAAEMGRLVELFIKAIEANDFDQRLRFLEAGQNATRPDPPNGGDRDAPVWKPEARGDEKAIDKH